MSVVREVTSVIKAAITVLVHMPVAVIQAINLIEMDGHVAVHKLSMSFSDTHDCMNLLIQ